MKTIIRSILLLCALASLTGCLSPGSSPDVRYFRLTAPVTEPSAEPSGSSPSLVVGPMEVSPYLRRPQIAERQGVNEIVYREFERWAEPLERNVTEVVAQILSQRRGTPSIQAFSPGQSSGKESLNLPLRLEQFDLMSENAVMRATVYFPEGAPWVFQGTEPLSGSGVEEDVMALNALLSRFATDLDVEITSRNLFGGSKQ